MKRDGEKAQLFLPSKSLQSSRGAMDNLKATNQ